VDLDYFCAIRKNLHRDYLVSQQHVDLFPLEQILRVQFVDNPVRYPLLVDLPVVDVLLHRVVGDEPIDEAATALAVAVHAAHGLAVMAWVPRGVEHHDAARSNQVDPEAPSPAQRDAVFSQLLIPTWAYSKERTIPFRLLPHSSPLFLTIHSSPYKQAP